MQTRGLHRIHLGHVLSPLGTGGKEHWCKYDNTYAISCAMSNKSFALTHESLSSARTHDTLTGKLSF